MGMPLFVLKAPICWRFQLSVPIWLDVRRTWLLPWSQNSGGW